MASRLTGLSLVGGVLLAASSSCADDVTPRPAGGGGEGGATANVGGATTGGATTGGSTTGGSTTSGPPTPFCGDGTVDPDEDCDDGNESPFDGCRPDCTVVAPVEAPPLEWTYVEVPGTQCMNGDPAGFGISINPDSPDVLIYLEGGGACFNDACDFTAFSVPFIPPPDGIFNRNNPANPVRAWSMVYVPYCTGDIHGGDKDTMLGGQIRHFKGYTNIATYLELWGATFPEATRVLLTGISAGGFGAGLNFAQVAEALGPGRQMVLVDDSGPPLSNDVIPPCLQQTFRDVWGLDETVIAACGADCADPNDFATGVLAHVASAYPDAHLAVFSNTADLVIRAFMGFGWGNGQYDECEGTPVIVPADVYEDGLLDLKATYETRASTFLVGQTRFAYNFGQNHTVLRSPSFWTTVIDGTSVAEWLGEVIDGQVVHVGP
jgi:cysteine-rich repeat protein